MEKLKEVKAQPLCKPQSSELSMQEACDTLPAQLSSYHGYHQDRYQKFIRNQAMLKEATCKEPESEIKVGSSRTKSNVKIIFKPDCISSNM